MKLRNIKGDAEICQRAGRVQTRCIPQIASGDVFNLKSLCLNYVAIGRLLEENGDDLELFADDPADEARLIGFLADLNEKRRQSLKRQHRKKTAENWLKTARVCGKGANVSFRALLRKGLSTVSLCFSLSVWISLIATWFSYQLSYNDECLVSRKADCPFSQCGKRFAALRCAIQRRKQAALPPLAIKSEGD